ncbi:hypothetical protein [Polyangium sp. y55x31]|uniref:hypothetical protein n=1 Tax=Polyangium sp. y55x31 TaxID=3042688 RepID=UPI002482FF94|nr:hypothetical protein [Polyangium sp. y55x31]MDI1484285.1 hypothetical protein [Polyangium sp. y55x31]
MISSRSFVAISITVVPFVFFACAKGSTRPGGDGGAGGEGGDGWGGPAQSSSSSGGMGGSGGMGSVSSSGAGAGSSSSSSGSSGSSSSSGSGGSGGGGNGPLPIVLLRIGDGVTTLSSAASPVSLEWRLTDGSATPGAPGTTAMPQSTSGSNYTFTLSGTASSEGHLSLSANGKYVFLAGYAAGVGTANVSTQSADVVPRVVGRVDAFGNVNTSTLVSGAFSGSNVRGATSSDGTSIWVSGNSTTTGGIQFITLGAVFPTQILSNPLNTRCVHAAGGQLYATSGAGTFVNVFTVGSGLPTSSGQTATSLPGLPTASASPYGFALLDLSAAIAGPDTLYIADDRSPASGGGIQKWTFDGFSWSLAATWNDGTAGVRGLAAKPSGAGVQIVATTSENNENRVLAVFDDGSAFPEIVIATIAPPNTVFRGVAFAPQ